MQHNMCPECMIGSLVHQSQEHTHKSHSNRSCRLSSSIRSFSRSWSCSPDESSDLPVGGDVVESPAAIYSSLTTTGVHKSAKTGHEMWITCFAHQKLLLFCCWMSHVSPEETSVQWKEASSQERKERHSLHRLSHSSGRSFPLPEHLPDIRTAVVVVVS